MARLQDITGKVGVGSESQFLHLGAGFKGVDHGTVRSFFQ